MKKAFLILLACAITLLTGCADRDGASGQAATLPAQSLEPSGEQQSQTGSDIRDGENPQIGGNSQTNADIPADGSTDGRMDGSAQPAVMTARVIQVSDDGNLLIAEKDGGSSGVYNLTVESGAPITQKDGGSGEQTLQPGMMIEFTYGGSIRETYPAQLGSAGSVTILPEMNTLCAMYLQVLEDLWAEDKGLNSNITQLGVDLSRTSLSPSEQSAVALAFGWEHEIMPLEGTYDELLEQGYITGEPLEGTDSKFYHWENGCLFTIREKETKGIFNLNTLTFDAEKWRSGLGAYYFIDCASTQSALGVWSDYKIGSQAIS